MTGLSMVSPPDGTSARHVSGTRLDLASPGRTTRQAILWPHPANQVLLYQTASSPAHRVTSARVVARPAVAAISRPGNQPVHSIRPLYQAVPTGVPLLTPSTAPFPCQSSACGGIPLVER